MNETRAPVISSAQETEPSLRLATLCSSISRLSGGIGPAVNGLNRALVKLGTNVDVYAPEDAQSAEDAALWNDMQLHLGPVNGPASFGWSPSVAGAVLNAEAEILHQHGLWMFPSVIANRWSRSDRPKVISPHGMLDPWALENSGWKKQIALQLFERANLNSANCIHALNHSERAAIRKAGFDRPVAVIPNGVDLEEFDHEFPGAPWADQIPPEAKVLLFLGRIHPKKGLEPLIRGLAGADERVRDDWHLVIAGWDQGGEQARLQAIIDSLGISGAVHFVGPQFGDAKGASFARADCFVLPSFSEGLPVAILEAWAFGLPVLMTDACNLPEGFEAGAASRIATDVSAMSSQLEKVLRSDPESLRAMGARGRQLVEDRFTWHRIAEQMKQVYFWISDEGPQPDCVFLD